MRFDIITLFPEMFSGPLTESILKRAQEKRLVTINLYNLRDWATDKHKTVDNTPYGGGAGMVIRVDVVDAAIANIKKQIASIRNQKIKKVRTIVFTPRGKKFAQKEAERLSKYDAIILLAGHYEGFDKRVHELADEEISIGDYVLTGGELPAMVVVDAVARLVPGVLGNPDSPKDESFSFDASAEYPQYTKPEVYKGKRVPEVLLSGDHKKIAEWRQQHRG